VAELVLGRDPEAEDSDIAIDTTDLVTHGVIVGMTGSGKTGLGIGLIEQTLAAGIPTLLIDPKGDLTNIALVFSGLTGPEFEPWVDPAQAATAGESVAEFAEKQAQLWRDGLSSWGIGPDQMREFKESFGLTIYTPGSTSGVALNVLGSLAAPETDDAEVIADEIEGYVSSLLSVVGIDADPLSSREHILLSNIINAAWVNGESLDLAALLARVQQPPIRKLGVFELDQFFPAKDRNEFAMRLNGVLAAPSFANWITGDPIDIQSMLYSAEGTPRCAVITTAHLSDEQRQSATALILAKLVTWMRRQSGTTDLRALLYMDEVAGYLPPTSNPPTKKPIMLLMKQARAFGIGVVLSTQNPVDVDYKALSNAGTWLIGRLTTERDKSRLLEGMSSAAGAVDVKQLGDAISGLGKRQFLLRKAGRNDVNTMATRWVRSYLRGPLTRDQIATVQDSQAVSHGTPVTGGSEGSATAATYDTATPPSAESSAPAASTGQMADDETPVMPTVAADIPVSHLDPGAPWTDALGLVMPTGQVPRVEAAAVARVMVRYSDARAELNYEEEFETIVFPLPVNTAGVEPIAVDYDDRDFVDANGEARYAVPEAKIANKTYWSGLERDIIDYLSRNNPLELFVNTELKVYGRPGETQGDFIARCVELAEAEADKKTAALTAKYDTKLRALQNRLATAAGQAEAAAAARTTDMISGVGSVLGGLLGGRRSTASLSAAARRASAAQTRATAAAAKVDDLQAQISNLELELMADVQAIDDDWQAKAAEVSTRQIVAKKTDTRVIDLRLVWFPTQ
jgi:hypothetical protein